MPRADEYLIQHVGNLARDVAVALAERDEQRDRADQLEQRLEAAEAALQALEGEVLLAMPP